MIRHPQRSPLFPSTPLFRSRARSSRPDGIAFRAIPRVGLDTGRVVLEFLPPLEPELLEIVPHQDRKSTRLNSSHLVISYAVFCLKIKNICIAFSLLNPLYLL